MERFIFNCWQIYLAILGFSLVSVYKSTVVAQVTSDGTVNTQVDQNGNTAEITGGETRGNNLFHSFQDFSVQTGNEAFFDNANDISNIFSRVTGGNISNIDGAIRANGSSNLFLINPAGIVFGADARLNLGGSFYGSTASSILFEDGEFSAADLENPPLLTVNAPIGLTFRDNPAEITNNSVVDNLGLQVLSGQNINLLGGNLNLTGGKITAPGGIITLGGLSTAGTINIEQDGNFRFPNNVAKANIFLTDSAVVNVTSEDGGLIIANANNLELTGESRFLAGIGEGLGSENSLAGTIQINATRLFANNNSEIRADNLGIGQGGIININTDILDFDNNSAIVASTFGQGDAGTVNITAQDISFEQEWGGIYSTVGLTRIATDDPVTEGVIGNGGNININTDTLELTDAAGISVNSVAQGNAGNININAIGEVSFSGVGVTPIPAFGGEMVRSGASSQVQFEGVGNSGQVNIEAGFLNLSDSGSIFVDNDGVEGDAGDINLNIQNNIFLDQEALIFAQVQEDSVGNAGNINITANSYESKGGSLILADTEGIGDGGNINIDIEETISLNEGSAIQTGIGENTVGNGGNININANSLSLDFSAGIRAQTEGQGNAGEISITTNEDISLGNESNISSSVTSSATGNGADISLTAGELNLTNQSLINASTEGQSLNLNNSSNAGDININIAGDINLDNDPENISSDNGNQIQSQVGEGAIGNAGNIIINTGGSFVSNNGNQILTGSEGIGNGGDIQITAGESIEMRDNSLIFANKEGRGNAGNVTLNAGETFSLSESLVLSQVENEAQGNSGEIDITANTIDINNFSLISTNVQVGAFGAAGNINLNGDNISINNGAVVDAFSENGFDGGNINLGGDNLVLGSGGVIVTSTESAGNAGSINLNLTGDITINGEAATRRPEDVFELREQALIDLQESTGLFATSSAQSTGSGGNIELNTFGDLSISNNGMISVDSQGGGNGGMLSINTDSLSLDNQATISAITASGTGGDINLITDNKIRLENNSIISTQASDNGNGGNISIDTNFIVAFPNQNNDIVANAQQGQGGNIEITAESIFGIFERDSDLLNSTNDIDASSEFSIDGNVTISIPDISFVQGATTLSQNVVESGETTAQACRGNRDIDSESKNGLTIAGKGGVPPAPELALDSQSITVDGKNTQDISETTESVKTSQGEIQPARGINVTDSGEVILTAHRTNNAGDRIPEVKRNCGRL